MGTAKKSIPRQRERFLPTGVQKSYFMLSDAERSVLNTALEKYQPGRSEPIFVGGEKVLKPALQLMNAYRLVIEEIEDGKLVSSYTRWVDAVHIEGNRQPRGLFNINDFDVDRHRQFGFCCTPEQPLQFGQRKFRLAGSPVETPRSRGVI